MSICLKVKVVPNSPKSEVLDGIIKVKSPPENNKANIEIVKLLSKKYKVSSKDIKIIGKTSRNKTIIIDK